MDASVGERCEEANPPPLLFGRTSRRDQLEPGGSSTAHPIVWTCYVAAVRSRCRQTRRGVLTSSTGDAVVCGCLTHGRNVYGHGLGWKIRE